MPQYPLAGRQPRGPFIPPTPPPQPIVPGTPRPPVSADEVRALINQIPGARATGWGNMVGFHIEASSIQEMIQKLTQLIRFYDLPPTKTICDGEPVRIT